MADSVFCTACGSKLEGTATAFCSRCGQKVVPGSESGPEIAQTPTPTPTYFEPIVPKAPKASKPPRKKMAKKTKLTIFGSVGAILVAVLTVAIVAGIDYSNHIHLADEESYALGDYVDVDQIDAVLESNCSTIAGGYASKKEYSLLKKRLDIVDGLAYGDARKSKAKIAGTSWITEWTPPSYSYNGLDSVPTAVQSQLEDVIAGQEKIYSSDVTSFYWYWEGDIESRALEICNINSVNPDYSDMEIRWSDSVQSARDFADTAPWYPEGYNEWAEDTNVAWRWDSGYYCATGDSCWHVKVISNTGCTDGVYVELNIKDSYGTVIDYTNDSLSYLGAGQSAQLELPTWNSSADTGEITKISCHNF